MKTIFQTNFVITKKVLMMFFFFFCLAISAQTSGGQIRRPNLNKVYEHKIETKRVSVKNKKQKPSYKNESSENVISSPKQQAILPISLSNLSTYNIVAGSFSSLEKSSSCCLYWRNIGFDANIFIDSKNLYRVILRSFYDEEQALNFRKYVRDNYNISDAWILYIVNGHEERYTK